MKAVVMEKKKRICVVLCDDGTFKKIQGDYGIGDTIQVSEADFIKDKKKVSAFRKNMPIFSSVAAAAALLFGIGYYETNTACSYVTLDASPSIEYTLNRLDKVIKIAALNEEAQPIIETLTHQGVKYNSIGDAIDMTVQVLRDNDYLTDDNSEIIIDVVADGNRTEKLTKQVENSQTASDGTLSLSLSKSDKEDRASANGSGISTGMYKAYKEGKAVATDKASSVTSASPAEASTAASVQKSEKPVVYLPIPAPVYEEPEPEEDYASNDSVVEEKEKQVAKAEPAPKPTPKKKPKPADPAATASSSDQSEEASATDSSKDVANADAENSSDSANSSSEASTGEAPAQTGSDESGNGGSEAVTPPTDGSSETPAPVDDPNENEDETTPPPSEESADPVPEPPMPPAPEVPSEGDENGYIPPAPGPEDDVPENHE